MLTPRQKPGRNVGIAHRMLDQEVGHRIADRGFAGRIEALRTRAGSLPSTSACGRRLDRIDWPGYPHVQRRSGCRRHRRRRQLALRDRMIDAVLHVLLARPDQLDRRARHLPWRSRPPDAHNPRAAAPAEAAAEIVLVDFAFIERHAGGFGQPRRTRLAVLRAGTQTSHCPPKSAVAFIGSMRGVVLVGVVVDRLDFLGGARDRRLGVAVLRCR